VRPLALRPSSRAAVLVPSTVLTLVAGLAVSGGIPSALADDGQQSTGMMPAGSPDARWDASSPTARALTAAAATTYSLGTDVASYQHPSGQPIDWKAVAASGQAFTIVKATESTTYTNPYARADVTGARGAGLVVGVYHYANPAVSATAQADYFARQVNGFGGTLLPPALDLETTGGLSPSALITWTSTFLTRLRQDTGRTPMIYTGPYFWSTAMAGSKAFAQYPLWEAHWTTAAAPQSVGGWPTWTLWQYSNGTYGSPAPVPGIPALVDRSRFGGTKAQLTALASTSRPGIVPPFTGTATAAQYPDGTFVHVTGDPYVYEIAGLAPLWVTRWSRVGGAHPVREITSAQFFSLRSSPLDGTYLVDLVERKWYRVAGGAALPVISFRSLGTPTHYASVDTYDLVNAGGAGPYSHLSSIVRDGTFLRAVDTNQVYVVAGGAPVFVSTWSTYGGTQPTVLVNQPVVDQAGSGGWFDRLRFVPADGTALMDGSTGQLYLVTAGHPAATDAATVGATPFTLVGTTAILNAGGTGVWSHLL
jgi:lysozyme